ncbi:Thrombospondin type 1 domain protein [Cryptosporidium hominis]|nr:hypothetical protein ChTU502y2012_406g0555 [Cryptosporidium hominis]PPA64829.1 Thrombospondin type 1 domain protein [Cryptosporidium hominis]
MSGVFNKFVICSFLVIFLCLGPEHVEFHLVNGNKVDLNQIEGNGRFEVENRKLIKSNNQINDDINATTKYSDYNGYNLPENSSALADRELKFNGFNITKHENRELYIDSNGSISSINNNSETNFLNGEIPNNSNEFPIKSIGKEHVISEHFDNHANSQYGDNHENFTNITGKEVNYNNFNISNNEQIRLDTLQAINNSFNVLTVDFSTIYDDLTFEPNLKSNVEYTIFNTSNIEVKKKIAKEIKTNNDGNFVVNLEDYSSYGFVTWIKPVESNSTKVILQSNSGIMPNMKIKLLEKLFPRRNFTNDELDVIILSESRNEIRPYGYRGSPMILTQFIENIDLNNESEDIFSFIETIETLNQTSYLKNSNNSLQILDNTGNNTAFEFWNNSFLLHDNPDILSINCNYYNEWSSWSACTNECGWGIQTRGRRINANLIDKSFQLSDFEISEMLRKCKVQVQTQGCMSKIGCCEYQSPKENLWKNCTATCDKHGTEEQTVELISNKKGKVKDSKCENKKILKRKCLRLLGDKCKTCETTEWSKWSSCNNENGDFIQKRTRELTNGNCTYSQTKLEERRICEKIPLFSTSPITNNVNNSTKQKFLISSENLNDKETIHEVKECELQKSEMKYNLIEGACECPNGVSFCDNTVIENDKTSWESHLKEICGKKTDAFSEKNLMIMAKGKRLYNCKTKNWEKYTTTPLDSDCKNTYILCKVESNCMVSSWSDWSGCSSPCKSSTNDLDSTAIFSTRFKTRKVISGECKEHSLFMEEECLDIKECPQTKYKLSIDKTSKELTNLLYSEDIKSHIKKTFTKLQMYNVQDDSVSNIMKNLFNNVRDIIIRNSEYIYELNFNFNVYGGDGNYHIQSYISFILSKYNFDDSELVKDIIIWVAIPTDENKEILYEKLSKNDREIIGSNKDETNEFLENLFPSKLSSIKNETEQNSSIQTGDVLTKNFSSSNNTNLNIENSQAVGNFNSEKESEIFSKIINPELLFKLIQTAILKNTNCKPIEINKQNFNESNSETKCVCPLGYTLCSSIDYHFGNHISTFDKSRKIEIRTPEGVFSDNFVLNQGGIFEQVYEEDKEKYCNKPGAKAMCSSNSELLDTLKHFEIKDLYSMFVRFQSAEESS